MVNQKDDLPSEVLLSFQTSLLFCSMETVADVPLSVSCYLYDSEIILVSGNYGPWTPWNGGSCSRTCGGGTTWETRICLGICTLGPSEWRSKSCNTQPCNGKK